MKKPDPNAVIAYQKLCEEFRENQKKIITNYERIARLSGNVETLKAILARKGEVWQK